MMTMSRTFKDFLQQDVNNVFVNQSEFAETAMINYTQMVIVPDNDAVNPSDTSKQLATYDVLFHVATSYFADGIPQSEGLMNFEGEDYRIKSVSDNLGMLTIGLSRKDA